MNRKKQFRWHSAADETLLSAVAATRPTSGPMWSAVADTVNAAVAGAAADGATATTVDGRGCKDRVTKILLPNFRKENREKIAR